MIDDFLRSKCTETRRAILTMLHAAGSGHSGGSLSCVELIVGLYYTKLRVSPRTFKDHCHDRFVLSKGHVAPCLYAVLADREFFPKEELSTLRRLHSRLQGHPDSKKLPGIEISTGSLGQGVSIATGMALAAKGEDIRVYSLLGDGELQEGLVWEACMAAAHYHLDNLTLLVDNNGVQLDGTCNEVMCLGDLSAKFRAFGFHVIELPDGNDIYQVVTALGQDPEKGKPTCILAHTIKGKGVSFMENNPDWHGKAPNDGEYERAMTELEAIRCKQKK